MKNLKLAAKAAGLLFSVYLIHSCTLNLAELNPDNVTVSTASIQGDNLHITGNSLNAITSVSIKQQDQTTVPLTITSQTKDTLVAAFASGATVQLMNAMLVYNTASAQTAASITVQVGGSLTCTTRTSGFAASSQATINCNSGETMTGGGYNCAGGGTYGAQFSYPNGNGWTAGLCYSDLDGLYETGTVYARCCQL